MGCGRTGPFFSFEVAGITPDIVCLSKSISGYGLPMSLTLFRPELDVWRPGEHNGTFRGNNPAFVTATAALREFWSDSTLEKQTEARALRFEQELGELAERHPAQISGVAVVVAWCGDWPSGSRGMARQVADAAFARGLLMETSGSYDEVAKLLPPLTATDEELAEGLGILQDAVASAVAG